MLRLVAGIDGRRSASWITWVSGLGAGWWLTTVSTTDNLIAVALAMLVAAIAAVAAIGDLPRTMLCSTTPGSAWGLSLAWACERSAWPVVGMLIGMLAAGGVPAFFLIAPATTVGALLAAVTIVAGRLSGAKAADAASMTLLVAAASAAASAGLAPRLGGSCLGGVAAWLLLGGLSWAWTHSQRTAIDTLVLGLDRAGQVAGADVLHVDALPANGPLRQTLSRLAMVAALLAMAGWLVFEPAFDPAAEGGQDHVGQHGQWGRLVLVHQSAVAWALFTAAWFIGLAVPQATLQDGVAGARDWELLFRTTPAAGRNGTRRTGTAWLPSLWMPRLGPVRFAGGVALSQAAILGWPVLVCAVLSLPTPAAARLPFRIVLGLAAAAAVVTAIVAIGTIMHASRETIFAATVAIMVVLVVGILSITANVAVSGRQPAQPTSPSPPSLVPLLQQRLRGG